MKETNNTKPARSHMYRASIVLISLIAGACTPWAKPSTLPTVSEVPAAPETLTPYRIHVGDKLSIKFYRNAELNQELAVRPDGKISLPFVDEVLCAGLTPAELDAELTRRYTGELAIPEITVIVLDFATEQIYVGGEVGQQGIHRLSESLTLYQAIQQAGGFLETAHRKNVILIRKDAEGEPQGHKVDLRPVVFGNSPTQDIPLQPYDIVFVPRSKIANVNVFVKQYIRGALPLSVVPFSAF